MEALFFKLGIAILGIVFYTVFKSLDHLTIWDWKVFVKENIKRWIWALTVIIIVSVLLHLLPETAEAIKTFTGIDVSTEPASFFTLGLGLSAMVRQATKTAIKSKRPVGNN